MNAVAFSVHPRVLKSVQAQLGSVVKVWLFLVSYRFSCFDVTSDETCVGLNTVNLHLFQFTASILLS